MVMLVSLFAGSSGMVQVLSRRFFFSPSAELALPMSSRLPPRTRGTQIFSITDRITAPLPLVGRLGGGSAAGAAAGGVAVASGAAGAAGGVAGAAGCASGVG